MASPIDLAVKLLALSDPEQNNEEHERANVSVKLVDMIRSGRVSLVVGNGKPVPKSGPVDDSLEGAVAGFRSALERELVIEGARRAQKRDDARAAREALDDAWKVLFSWPLDLRRGAVGTAVFCLIGAIEDEACAAIDPPGAVYRKSALEMENLGKLLMDRGVVRASDLKDTLSEAVDDLFKAHGELPGADTIARMLGRRAADVRADLRWRIENGYVEAVGNGRARRYRKVPVDENGDPIKPTPSQGGTRKTKASKAKRKPRPNVGRESK